MVTLTIPKKITQKGDLVVIPRKDYEAILEALKKRVFIDKGLQEALKEVESKKIIGPFNNVKDLIKSLRSRK